jgi:hypothetical protein
MALFFCGCWKISNTALVFCFYVHSKLMFTFHCSCYHLPMTGIVNSIVMHAILYYIALQKFDSFEKLVCMIVIYPLVVKHPVVFNIITFGVFIYIYFCHYLPFSRDWNLFNSFTWTYSRSYKFPVWSCSVFAFLVYINFVVLP